MAWIESHEDLHTHPKVFELMTALNADLPTTIGVLHLLWHFTMKFAWKNGDLSKFTSDAIAKFVGWKDGKSLVLALQKSGWLDEMKVHDWMDYAGKIVRDRIYNIKKRRKTPTNGDKIRQTSATVPNRTVPYLTVPKEKENGRFAPPSHDEVKAFFKDKGYLLEADKFFFFYSSKGWLVGKAPMKNWHMAAAGWLSRAGLNPKVKETVEDFKQAAEDRDRFLKEIDKNAPEFNAMISNLKSKL